MERSPLVDADLGDGGLHAFDLAGHGCGVGAHRLIIGGHMGDGRQGDGHVLGDEDAVDVHGVGEDGALQVKPQICHYSSPPS